MIKYTLIVFVLAFSLFNLNVNSISAFDSGCNSVDPYSATTGQLCSTSFVAEVRCPTGDLFSSATGERCNAWAGTSLRSANQQFQIGDRGESVRAYQQILKDTGFLLGKVDGIYGPITSAASARYYQKYPYPIRPSPIVVVPPEPCPLSMDANGTVSHVCPPSPFPNSPVVVGISGPQSLTVNEVGTWSLIAYDPNGGNLSYSVDWGDQPFMLDVSASPSPDMNVRQSAVFTHSYTQAGNYVPTFTVTSENTIRCITTPCPVNGGSAKTSLSVKVD